MGGLVRSQLVSRVVLSGALLAVAVTAAFLLSMGLIALTGGSALSAASAMLQGSVESTASLMTSLERATPLLLVAIGTVVAGRAGLINVGQEGQVLVGAMLRFCPDDYYGEPCGHGYRSFWSSRRWRQGHTD